MRICQKPDRRLIVRRSRNAHRALALALVLLTPVCALAQRFAFKYYSHDQGLISLDVISLLQDRTGYIWVGTTDGVFRYDGSRFMGFRMAQGLPSNRIVALYATADGTIWTGTRDGLAHLQGDRFVTADFGERASFLSMSGLASDSSDTLYAGTGRGLWALRRSSRSPVKVYPVEPLAHPEVYGVHAAPDGVVWFGCGTSLCKYEHGKIATVGSESGVPSDVWNAILTDRSGNLWIRSSTRLLKKPA